MTATILPDSFSTELKEIKRRLDRIELSINFDLSQSTIAANGHIIGNDGSSNVIVIGRQADNSYAIYGATLKGGTLTLTGAASAASLATSGAVTASGGIDIGQGAYKLWRGGSDPGGSDGDVWFAG